MKIKSAIVIKKGEIKIEETVLDDPKENEVLVKVVASGICHTDIETRDNSVASYPVALGHEGSGIIKKVGAAVQGLSVGDHVVVSAPYCGHCQYCLSGHPMRCLHGIELMFGGKNYDGTNRIHELTGENISTFFGQSSLAEYIVADQHGITKVDNDVDLRLLAPLGCGIQTGAGTVLTYFKPTFGQSIVVFGVGGVGLSAIMAAKIVGMSHIIAVGRHDDKLSLAKKLGATETINSSKEDVVSRIHSITNGGADYSIDTTGVSSIVNNAISSLKIAGECAVLAFYKPTEIDLEKEMISGSKKIVGVLEGDAVPQNFIPQMISYYKKGIFPFDQMIKFFDFDHVQEAFDSMDKNVIKPVVIIDKTYQAN